MSDPGADPGQPADPIDPIDPIEPVRATRTRRVLRRPAFVIGDLEVRSGRSGIGELPVARMVTGTRVSLPLHVVHGLTDGPVVWLSAAVHGDEIAGVEIIRRALGALDPRTLAGTVIAVPIVNPHGFLASDRYLPDRRDLNRSFPGSANGSLAARLAHLFMTEVVARAEVGIDLHTGSDHRTNLPQVRADLDDPLTHELASSFGAPVMLHAKLRDGSLRAAATARGARVLLYEGGEALRYERAAIAVGVTGIGRLLARLGMTETVEGAGDEPSPSAPPIECRSSTWVRARRSGIAITEVELGDHVDVGDTIAVVRDSVGRRLSTARATRPGIVIGLTQHPLVNQGDAIAHVAQPEPSDTPADADGRQQEDHQEVPDS